MARFNPWTPFGTFKEITANIVSISDYTSNFVSLVSKFCFFASVPLILRVFFLVVVVVTLPFALNSLYESRFPLDSPQFKSR